MTFETTQGRAPGGLLGVMLPGVRAVRRNWAPLVLLQAIAVALVLCYYRFPTVRTAMKSVGALKQEWGIAFVILAGAVAGGLLPQIAKAITILRGRTDAKFWKDTLYLGFAFAAMAIEINTFYGVQTSLFGTSIDIVTLIKKTSVDMLLFTPLICVPTGMALLYARQNRQNAKQLLYVFSWAFYRRYVVSTLPINWAFWIPVLFCVYSLPTDLQFPFSQFAEAAWSLLFVFISNEMNG